MGTRIIRCSSRLKLLKLQGELLAYRLNGDAQWAHLRPQHRVSPTGVIGPEAMLRNTAPAALVPNTGPGYW